MKETNNIQPKGYLRIWHILGDSKSEPPIPPLIPVSKSTWWLGVKTGKYPKPVKLGKKIAAWKTEDIHNLIQQLGENTNEET